MKTALALVLLTYAAGFSAASDAQIPEPVVIRRSLISRWFGKKLDRSLLRHDKRAVPLVMDSYLLSNLRTGDRVDIVAVFDATTKAGKDRVAATILQNALVLGVETGKSDGKGVLTLRLNPNELQLAALAQSVSQLFVALRQDGDQDVHPMEIATFKKLFL